MPSPPASELTLDTLWSALTDTARTASQRDPLLATHYERHLLGVADFTAALAEILADTLTTPTVARDAVLPRVADTLTAHPAIAHAAQRDLLELLREDAAIAEPFTPLLFFPGYRALQCYRLAHVWWHEGLTDLAGFVQFRAATCFAADIHPAASIGEALFIDHGAGIVIGETAVIEDRVTLFHGVTLGGTGKLQGDRHPKVRRGAFLGAGATLVGNIEIGEGARVAAGAIVTRDVPAHTTVLGPSARPR